MAPVAMTGMSVSKLLQIPLQNLTQLPLPASPYLK
jgi:hypothetical protein